MYVFSTQSMNYSTLPLRHEHLAYRIEGNQKNYRKYKFAVQGTYMDWVANGNKYEVERNFVRISMAASGIYRVNHLCRESSVSLRSTQSSFRTWVTNVSGRRRLDSGKDRVEQGE